MRKIFLVILVATLSFASTYSIKYKGITLGKIDSLDTLKDDYLKAKVTNSIVKFMMRKDYFIFYSGQKPKSQKTKFKHDNKKIIFALKKAMQTRPLNEEFIIDNKRKIILKCDEQNCTFDYYSKGSHNAEGTIEFKNGEFYKLTEKKSSLEIVKDEK
jgi:hypothetical protein